MLNWLVIWIGASVVFAIRFITGACMAKGKTEDGE